MGRLRRVTEARHRDARRRERARDPPDDDSTFMPRTAEVAEASQGGSQLGIEVPYALAGHEARGRRVGCRRARGDAGGDRGRE